MCRRRGVAVALVGSSNGSSRIPSFAAAHVLDEAPGPLLELILECRVVRSDLPEESSRFGVNQVVALAKLRLRREDNLPPRPEVVQRKLEVRIQRDNPPEHDDPLQDVEGPGCP